MPAHATKLDAFLYIALSVAADFLLPELCVAFGHYKVSASFVPVPETAVDEDDGLVFPQHDIWCAGQLSDVDAVAVATGMEVAAHEHLGLGVLAAYA